MKADINTYTPSADEKYMNSNQINYFKDILDKWRFQTQHNLIDVEKRLSDLNASDEKDDLDKAFLETEVSITINKISALQNLLNEIDISLGDIVNGSYGFCKKTGKEIGLKRLMAKPTSRFAIKAQEDNEREIKIKETETVKFADNEEFAN
jgi:DnaK suppressor protein